MNRIVVECYQDLLAGATLVTATKRLARSLRHDYDQMSLESGKKTWDSPDILPLSAWLGRSIEESQRLENNIKQIFTTSQEELLWQKLVAGASQNVLLDLRTTARRAMEAWRLVQHYELDQDDEEFQWTKECRLFVEWASLFEDKLVEHNAFAHAQLPVALMDFLLHKKFVAPKTLILAGFIEFTPIEHRLLNALNESGTSLRSHFDDETHTPADLKSYTDIGTELKVVAQSCRRLLEEKPKTKIGVVLPQLEKLRGKTESIFRDVLNPSSTLRIDQDGADAFHLSLGPSLASQPLIRDALTFLALSPSRLSVHELDTILLSPFLIGAAEECSARAKLNASLRRLDELDFSWRFVFHKLESGGVTPSLYQVLEAFHQAAKPQTDVQHEPYVWAKHFSEWLNVLGFSKALKSSREFVIWQAWEQALAELSSLSFLCGQVPIHVAYEYLQDICERKLFQVPNKGEPIQIMGMLEALGENFDTLFLVNMHEDVLPQALRPNPFLPLKIQKKKRLPHATFEQSEAYATRLLDDLCGLATQVHLSCPEYDEGRKIRPSPLLKKYGALEVVNTVTVQDGLLDAYAVTSAVETFVDDLGPAVTANEKIRGGTALVLDQAACPFRAFAKHRLGARSPEEPTPGLSAHQRGTLVHEVLRNFWQGMKSLDALGKLDAQEKEKAIALAVDQEVDKFILLRPASLPKTLATLERRRLRHLLHKWLDIEALRQPFVVEALEEKMDITIGNITLSTIVDRIDRLPEGGLMIVDYKTGDARVAKWIGERPDDPQLPIYAVAQKEKVSALAFARLKRGELGFAGVARKEGFAPNVHRPNERLFSTAEWGELIKMWAETQKTLMHDFEAGKAQVDPKRGRSTCTYCGLEVLCRVHSIRAGGDA
ncbi:MAG: PD-(D/E)XK nuclease family protein [Myxococcota bacterium]|jgi:probable DNA repair protein|nr:PD-(D/E)XK nuclease family protein [Myxococcota bacterium]